MPSRAEKIQQWVLHSSRDRIALAALLLSLGAWLVFWFDLA